MAVKITKSQMEVSKIKEETSEENNKKTSAIGFILSEEGDEYIE